MKAIAALLALLLLFAFLAGCAQPEEGDGGDGEEQPTPTPDEGFTTQEEDQELDDFETTLISEDGEIEIGDIV